MPAAGTRARTLRGARWAAPVLGVALAWSSALASAQARRQGRPSRGVLARVVAEPAVAPEPVAPSELPPAPSLEPEPEPADSASRSIGSSNGGRLRRSVALATSAHLVVRGGRRPSVFGTAELVGAIERASTRVGEEHPGPRLVVGDLSAEHGGRLSPHRSHRSGRDADLSFYVLDEEGRPAEPPHFVQLQRSGCGELRGRRYCIDPVRSYALIAALVSDPVARVQYVLVAPDLRTRLLAEGARQNAPAELLERVRIATDPHSGSHSHRSHFHLRIYCPLDDRPECLDEPPYHAWYEGTPAPRSAEAARRRMAEHRRHVVRERRARVRAQVRGSSRRRGR